jgi:hypothetical protein
MSERKHKNTNTHGCVGEDKYDAVFEELDFIAVNCGEEEEDPFWCAQLREDVTNMHAHHHLIQCTWLENEPKRKGVYIPGNDDTVLAGSIICRVQMKDTSGTAETGPQTVFSLSQKQKDRALRKLVEQTTALAKLPDDEPQDMLLMHDSDNESHGVAEDEKDGLFDARIDLDEDEDDDKEWRSATNGRLKKRARKDTGNNDILLPPDAALSVATGLLVQNTAIVDAATVLSTETDVSGTEGKLVEVEGYDI